MTSVEPQLTVGLGVLSAMVTPAILVLAAASMIGATASRLVSLMAQNREISRDLDEMQRAAEERGFDPERGSFHADQLLLLHDQVDKIARRATVMQRVLLVLHLSVAVFVLTVFAIGLGAVSEAPVGFLPAILGLSGAGLLLFGVAVLIYDGRLGTRTTNLESQRLVRRIDARIGRLYG